MPNVQSTLKALVLRFTHRVPLAIKRKNRTVALANASATPEPSASAPASRPSSSANRLISLPKPTSANIVAAGTTGITCKSRGTSRAIVKDVLFISLEALAESADVPPPLKSAVCGLLFLTKQVDLMSSNKKQISDIYAQIDAFAASLVRAIPDATTISPEHEAAVRVLSRDLDAIVSEMKGMHRHGRIVRLLRAKRHSSHLEQFVKRLDQANQSFNRTMLSSVEVKVSEIHRTVQPLRDEVHCLARIGKYFFLTRFFLPCGEERCSFR